MPVQLYNAKGQEIVVAKASGPKKMDFKVRGNTGLVQQGGRIDMELNLRLRGDRGPLMFREMADNDAVIGTILYLVKTYLKQPEWVAHPAIENDPESLDWAEFVDSLRDDMSHTWSDFMSEVVSMCPQGWVFFEVIYKRREGPGGDIPSKFDDGYVGWRKFCARPQATLDHWELEPDGGIKGMWQRPPQVGASLAGAAQEVVFLPIEYALLFRTETTGNNPQGRSMLRNAVRSYLFLKRIQEIEATGVERDLSGYPVMEVPLSLFEDQFDGDGNIVANGMLTQLQTQLAEVRRDAREGAIIPTELNEEGKPTGYRFRLMNGGGSRALNLDAIIKRYESRMAMCLLAEFVLLGTDKVGSYSMHASKTDVFAVGLRALLRSIADTINRYAVTKVCALNGCPPEKTPYLVPGDLAAPPLADIVQYVLGMSNAGLITADAAGERWARQQVGMPEPEPDAVPGQALEEGEGGMDDESKQTESEEAEAADA